MTRSSEELVREFFGKLEAKDIEGLLDLCTSDVVYENVPVPAMNGHAEIHRFLTGSKAFSKSDFEGKIVAIATTDDGTKVLTERLDVFVYGDHRIDVPVMGILEVRGEKISAWRDYADIGTFVRNMRAAGLESGPGIAERY